MFLFLKLFIISIIVNFEIMICINTSHMSGECKYVHVSLPSQIKIKNQNPNTRFVMDDMYNRFAKKYHMSSNQIRNCLETKYKSKNKK